jgi:hypothetical protein
MPFWKNTRRKSISLGGAVIRPAASIAWAVLRISFARSSPRAVPNRHRGVAHASGDLGALLGREVAVRRELHLLAQRLVDLLLIAHVLGGELLAHAPEHLVDGAHVGEPAAELWLVVQAGDCLRRAVADRLLQGCERGARARW